MPVESQLKNLLFNLLLKDGQHSSVPSTISPDYVKQRNDILAIIASSLNKIEGHLSKISKVASNLAASNGNQGDSIISQLAGQAQHMATNPSASVSATTNVSGDTVSGGSTIASDNNNNSFNISNAGAAPNITTNQRGNE